MYFAVGTVCCCSIVAQCLCRDKKIERYKIHPRSSIILFNVISINYVVGGRIIFTVRDYIILFTRVIDIERVIRYTGTGRMILYHNIL